MDKPVVEGCRSAVESRRKVLAGEKFRAGVRHETGLSSTDGLVSNLIIAGDRLEPRRTFNCKLRDGPFVTLPTALKDLRGRLASTG
jgi:hypothetical protein